MNKRGEQRAVIPFSIVLIALTGFPSTKMNNSKKREINFLNRRVINQSLSALHVQCSLYAFHEYFTPPLNVYSWRL